MIKVKVWNGNVRKFVSCDCEYSESMNLFSVELTKVKVFHVLALTELSWESFRYQIVGCEKQPFES